MSTLLTGRQCADRLAMHPRNWSRYADRWPALRDGLRYVRTRRANGHGGARWLESAVDYHVETELKHPDLDRDYAEPAGRRRGQRREDA